MSRDTTTPSGRIVRAGERRNERGRKNKMGLCQALGKFGTLALLSPGWIISTVFNFKVNPKKGEGGAQSAPPGAFPLILEHVA